MANGIPFVLAIHDWDHPYDSDPKYGSLVCPKCHNPSVSPIKRREFFVLLFVPLIPVHWSKQLHCQTCGWRKDFANDAQIDGIISPSTNHAEEASQLEPQHSSAMQTRASNRTTLPPYSKG